MMSAARVPLSSPSATVALGARIARVLEPHDLVLLSGDLGAGKTYLARALLRELGVPEEEAIASPTFSLVNEYDTDIGPVLHVDLYRLREPGIDMANEVRRLGLRERRAEGAIVLVEWGEGAETLFGAQPPALVVALAAIAAEERVASLSGPKAHAVAAE